MMAIALTGPAFARSLDSGGGGSAGGEGELEGGGEGVEGGLERRGGVVAPEYLPRPRIRGLWTGY